MVSLSHPFSVKNSYISVDSDYWFCRVLEELPNCQKRFRLAFVYPEQNSKWVDPRSPYHLFGKSFLHSICRYIEYRILGSVNNDWNTL